MNGQSELEQELVDCPTDGISSIKFAPEPYKHLLIGTSWDSTTRVWDVKANQLKHCFTSKAPVLDCCFNNTGDQIFSAGLDRQITGYDLTNGIENTILGIHEKEIKCLEYSSTLNVIFSACWGGIINGWDHRMGARKGTNAYSLPPCRKIFTMAISETKLMVGTASRQILIYDLRDLSKPCMKRESPLKNQTRCIRIAPTDDSYIVSSIEGRVGVEYIDETVTNTLDPRRSKYQFKCHRVRDTVYPVNALAYHPFHGTFATGGCDGTVNLWDGDEKKRLIKYPTKRNAYTAGIASLAFNYDGSMLAIASSYTFENGEKPRVADKIYIRQPFDTEVRKKSNRY